MLDSESVVNCLLALATGFPDRAVNIVAMSTDIDEQARGVLWRALTVDDDRSATVRRFGDALRGLGADRNLVNECYRVAFYAGDEWKALSDNPLYSFFTANKGGHPLDKWVHYFPIYEHHLAPFRGRPIRLLEIGVYRGGGLEMLSHYLGPDARLVGIDIDEAARAAIEPLYHVEVGDQADPVFLRSVATKHGPFDVVIDDGGHTMRQQIVSAETLFPVLVDGGTYIVEDCHTSYWPEFADQDLGGPTFLNWAKSRVDDMHAHHFSAEEHLPTPWQTDLAGLHVYDSVVVFDKKRRAAPFSELTGTKEFINYNRAVGIVQLELLATRDAAIVQSAKTDAAFHAETDAFRAETDAFRDELRLLRGELSDVRQKATRLDTELTQTRIDLHGSWEIVREMRHSTSWKLTAPLRRVRELLRRP